MTSSFNALLSDIYRLLSLYGEDDFLQAAHSRRVDPLLREALRALAKPARDARMENTRISKRRSVDVGLEQVNETGSADLVSMVTKAIVDSSPDKLLEVFSRNGVFVEKKPKESRNRLGKRLVAALQSAGPSRRRKLIEELVEVSGGQTAGWINVLRNRG